MQAFEYVMASTEKSSTLLKTAIVVPCFNESRRLVPESFRDIVRRDSRIDIIFVDDGSTDDTRRILQALCLQEPGRIQCHAFDVNRGKAEAVRLGFMSAFAGGYGFVGYWDADLAIPIDMIPRFIDQFNDRRIQLVIGSRRRSLCQQGRRRISRFYIGKVLSALAAAILHLGIRDTQCGAKLFRNSEALRKVFNEPFSATWVFDVEVLARFLVLAKLGEVAADALSNGLVEYPVEAGCDIPGSKVRLYDIVKAPVDLWRIYRNLRRNLRSNNGCTKDS